MISDSAVSWIVNGLLALGGGGSVVALFKVAAQRRKIESEGHRIVVDAAEGAVVVHSGVIKDLKEELARLREHIGTLEMENIAQREQQAADQASVERLRMSVEFLQKDLDRHGRMTELARRRSHVLSNAFSALELMVYNLIDEMRKHEVPVPEKLLPYDLCVKLRNELEAIAILEAKVTYHAVTEAPPEGVQ